MIVEQEGQSDHNLYGKIWNGFQWCFFGIYENEKVVTVHCAGRSYFIFIGLS